MSSIVNNSRKQKTISSSLWAAYGDALGFPTELANSNMVHQRLGAALSQKSIAWKRLVGGRFGAQVELCSGAYSDDTQLRLATSRSIESNGFFDVESFAKIELPVWLSYSLGAGRGSKAAASALSDQSSNWFSNFYSVNDLEYINGGGNGAAMRIQPHIWSASDLYDERSILAAVIRNAISTHGHIRGIAGAMVHAIILARILRYELIPSPQEWVNFSEVIRTLPELISSDSELSTFWLPTWEKLSGIKLEAATQNVANEWITCVTTAQNFLSNDPKNDYFNIVKELGGLTQKERGSGLKSALFSLAACWLFRNIGAKTCIETIVNYLESDTDTIATMAGALFGSMPNQNPPMDTIQDLDYLEADAIRLFEISQHKTLVERFPYPDLLYWQPPKTALDCVGLKDGKYGLAGFGQLSPISGEFPASQKGTVWQWFQLDFGQTVLCKRRSLPKEMPTIGSKMLSPKRPKQIETLSVINDRINRQNPSINIDLFSTSTQQQTPPVDVQLEPISIDRLTDSVIRSNFDTTIIGEALLRICHEENAIELALGFSAIIVKARKARMRRNS